MKLRGFTLRWDPELAAFDTATLDTFGVEHDVLQVWEHFVVHDGAPVWALVVGYRGRPAPAEVRGAVVATEAPLELSDTDRPVFEALRKWRNTRSRADGRPPYVLFTNGQLAAIALHRPATLAALREIPGVGEAKSRDYGAEVLAVVATQATAVGAEPADGG